MPRVLVIEDNADLAYGLQNNLEIEGYEVRVAEDGETGLKRARAWGPDLIILDLMLPDMNGYQVCEAVRRTDARLPILMLTARSQEVDKVRGLASGADDYVTKPFSVNELVARVRALLRRSSQSTMPDAPMAVGDAIIDPVSQIVRQNGVESPLSHHEVEFLRLLLSLQGQPVTREEILERVWGYRFSTSSRTIDNFIVKLRRKVEKRPDKPEHILTVYGYGYKLVL